MLTGPFNGGRRVDGTVPVATPGDTGTAEQTITDAMITDYASIVGDENPLHLDEAYAHEGPFDGIVAHGMLGGGIISAALADLPGDIVYITQELAFEAPVRPGDTVTATATVTSVNDGDAISVDTTARTNEVVISGTATVLSLPH